ncbi:alpha/beta fold hydrolase [Streptantibioticus ferralitis]|uniref:Alpha/beta hydrolase n=1 Tax=Streptantibioticus ferralitis TaxID=236510 RepID=A0ABT5Z0K2_9ACTN|nr:alpha/beta hydrolase [Streptantibioticus ferralitis]MDF2257363.1 alpha/beta hydrolase [Streptantibioticus ferralitis]
MRYVASGTDLVEYATAGSGPGLVLVHGTGSDAESNYGHLVGRFSDRHTVITPNYSGSGGTKDSGGPLTIDGLARQVEAAVADAGAPGPVAVVGFSLGAAVAAALAAIRPELVSKLVLVAGWAATGPRQRLAFGLWRRLWTADPALFARFVTTEGWSSAWLDDAGDTAIERTVAQTSFPDGARRQIDLDIALDIRALLPDITAPTLVVGAARDQIVPVAYTRELHESIPGSRYEELDSGHLVIHERPAELAGLIRDFVA